MRDEGKEMSPMDPPPVTDVSDNLQEVVMSATGKQVREMDGTSALINHWLMNTTGG